MKIVSWSLLTNILALVCLIFFYSEVEVQLRIVAHDAYFNSPFNVIICICLFLLVMQTTWRERNQQTRLKCAKDALDKNPEYVYIIARDSYLSYK